MNKKIITAVGIVFALVFVSLLSVIFAYVAKTTDDVATGVDKQQRIMSNMDLSQYDGTTVNGKAVKYAIDNLKINDDIKLGIGVYSINPKNAVWAWIIYGYDVVVGSGASLQAGYTSSYGSALNTDYRSLTFSDRGYIFDDGLYTARLVKAGTGTIVGIEFKQIKES